MASTEVYDQMAASALDSLLNVQNDVSDIKELLTQYSEVGTADEPELTAETDETATEETAAEDSQTVYMVALDGAPENFYGDLMAFQWCQVVVNVVLLGAVLLLLGVNLWQSFNRHFKVG